jgi:hypothetical protein
VDVVIGFRMFPIILGTKMEECAACGHVCQHILVRQTWWGCLFWLPVLLLGFKHSMICGNCGAETGIPFPQMVPGVWSRNLPLARQRPNFESLPPDELGFKPTPAQYFDPVTPNPKRSLGALYFMLWPVLCAALICILVVRVLLFPPQPR